MADGDTVITIKLKLDEGDAESSAATAGKDAGEAFRKAFEEAAKGLDVSKSLKSDDLKKTFSQIGDEGKKTAKDLQDAFAKVQMPAAAPAGAPAGLPGAAPAVPRMRYRPPEEDRRQEEQIHRHIENVSKGLEAFSSLLRGASLVEVARTAGPVFSALLAGRGGIAAGGRAAARAVSAEEVAGGGRAEEVLAGGIGAAVGGGVRGATGGGIAARFAGGAVGELLGGRVGAAIGTLAAGFIGSKIIDTITETGEAIKEMGIKGAVTDVQMVRMAQTMGISTKGLLELRGRFSESGVDIEDFSRAIYRLSTSAQREMPVIQRQIKDANNVIVESNIKVSSSTREVAKAQDDRLATTERVTTAEGELAKFEATGAETRREQARAAELGVSGATIRLRGAQMQERQAQIGLQFAPAQEALQAAQGPLTIKGAEVGLGGARIQQWRAGIALRQAEGQPVEQEEIKNLQLASARHQYAAASQARKEAEQRVKQAESEAGEREAERAAGLGPTGQARQRMLQAAQAEQQAELAQQQAKTAKINLEFDQAYTPLLAQRNQRQRQLNEARRQEEAAPEAEELAKINKERATIARDHLKYEQIPSVQRAVQAAARGEEQPGFEFKEVPADVFRNAIIAQGGGQVGPILDVLSQFLRSPAMRGAGRAQQLQRVTDVLGTVRGIGGAEGPQGLLDTLLAPPERRTPEQEKYFNQMAGLLEQRLPESRKLIGRAGEVAEDKALEDLRTGLSAKSFADSILKLDKTVDSFSQGMKRFLLGTVGETDLEEGAPTPRQGRAGSAQERFLARQQLNALQAAATTARKEADTAAKAVEGREPTLGMTRGQLQALQRQREEADRLRKDAEDKEKALAEAKAAAGGALPTQSANTPSGKATSVTVAGGNINVTGTVAVTNMPAAAPAAAPESAKSGDVTATEQARGGLIRGPGSGTSDSIPILASNGEYIIRQSRVAQLGVPFLDALNNRRVRFNLGGLVSLQHGGEVDSPSSLQSYDETSVQHALYKAWVDAHGTTPDPDSWAQVMKAKLNPETALDRHGNITEEAKKQAEQKRQGLLASLPPELTDQSFWARLARTGRTNITPGDPKSALAIASPGYMNELRRQMGLPPLVLAGGTADLQGQNAAADAQRAQVIKAEQNIADQLRTDVWSRLAMTGSTMLSPGDPHSAGIVASPKFMRQLRESLGIKVPVDQDMSVDAQLARTGVAWGGTTHSIKIVASPKYQNILRERFGLPQPRLPVQVPGERPLQAPTVQPPGPQRPGGPPPPDLDEGFTTINGKPVFTGNTTDLRENLSRIPQTTWYMPNGVGGYSEMVPGSTYTKYSQDSASGKYGRPYRDVDGNWTDGLTTFFESPAKTRTTIAEQQRRSAARPRPAEAPPREESVNAGDEGNWRGGLIRLFGGGLVPAMVSNGEYRMSPEAVSHYGVSLFDRLNSGGFAGGGSITMGRAQPPRPAGFPSGFSPIPEPGLIGEIANAMHNIGSVDPGVIRTITGVASGAGEVASTHRLDLVTSAGTFTVQAGAETLAAIQSSAIGGKLTSTGARPSWY
jgi:hypothetical protein